MASALADRDVDIVLFGATGFVGRLVADYLARHAPDAAAIALGGRSRQRLETVREALPPRAQAWPLVVADSGDRESLDRMARSASVVLTTVGPYAALGLPLAEACAAAGTHYADLAGEVTFMRAVIDRCDATARATGARLVSACGVDSIPSDLGTWELARRVAADGRGEPGATTAVVTAFRGGLGGGSVASGIGEARRARTDPTVRALLDDPYALSPDRSAEPELGPEPEVDRLLHDGISGRWVGPFLMAAINTRVVRRTNALLGHAYGRHFRYREVVDLEPARSGAQLAALAAAAPGAAMRLVARPGVGAAAEQVLSALLPGPGRGPSERVRRSGRTGFEIHTRTTTGAHYVQHIQIAGDPGYTATALLMGEAGLALAVDAERLPDRAGALTPAIAFDGVLTDRLRAAGVTMRAERRARAEAW